jgi:hypothetical protein
MDGFYNCVIGFCLPVQFFYIYYSVLVILLHYKAKHVDAFL